MRTRHRLMSKERMTRLLTLLLSLAVCLPSLAQEPVLSQRRKDIRTSGDVAAGLLPVAAATAGLLEKDPTGLKQAALACAGTFGVTYLLKKAVHKDRPDHSGDDSFPSRHTAMAFTLATFLQQRYGWQWGVPAYAAATYIGWTRLYGKKHDGWDVAAGAAIGTGCALLFTRRKCHDTRLTLAPTPNGLYASWRF